MYDLLLFSHFAMRIHHRYVRIFCCVCINLLTNNSFFTFPHYFEHIKITNMRFIYNTWSCFNGCSRMNRSTSCRTKGGSVSRSRISATASLASTTVPTQSIGFIASSSTSRKNIGTSKGSMNRFFPPNTVSVTYSTPNQADSNSAMNMHLSHFAHQALCPTGSLQDKNNRWNFRKRGFSQKMRAIYDNQNKNWGKADNAVVVAG